MKMGIVGFSYSKFDCERTGVSAPSGLKIEHNIRIKDVQKSGLNVGGSKNEVLKIIFAFDINYQELGKINVEGEVIYSDTQEIISETFKEWENDNKLNNTVSSMVFKFIYNKTIIKVLEISDSLGLPAPIQLPKVNFDGKKE